MRSARSEHVLLAVLLAIPLGVAFFAWPAFVRWAAGPSPAPTPELAGANARSTAVVDAPTRRPTVGAPPTVDSRATPIPTVSADQTPVPAVTPHAVTSASAPNAASESVRPSTPVVRAEGPSATVQDFYARVAAHDFNAAASLWSPRMRAAYPPAQNIDQRFSEPVQSLCSAPMSSHKAPIARRLL